MQPELILPAILLSALCTFALRALPFAAFRGGQVPDWLTRLGKALPSAIMAVLIVYCLRDIPQDWVGVSLPRLLAVGVVAVSYKWKHNTLLSIGAGTVAYMLLLRLF